MRRVGEAQVAQSIGNEKVSEFVVKIRDRNGVVSEKSETKGDRREEQNGHRPAGMAGQPRAEGRYERPPEQRHGHQENGQRQLDKIDCAEADRIIERRKCLK
jgi:hypothetical protein